jgi:hypothetical protein
MSEPTEYKLNESERRHMQEVHTQMKHFEEENLRLEGAIRRNETELSMMRRHIRLLLGQMADEHNMPMGGRLTPDFSRLMAPTAAEGKPDGVAS